MANQQMLHHIAANIPSHLGISHQAMLTCRCSLLQRAIIRVLLISHPIVPEQRKPTPIRHGCMRQTNERTTTTRTEIVLVSVWRRPEPYLLGEHDSLQAALARRAEDELAFNLADPPTTTRAGRPRGNKTTEFRGSGNWFLFPRFLVLVSSRWLTRYPLQTPSGSVMLR